MRNISIFFFLFVFALLSSCTEQESTVRKPEAVQVSVNAGKMTLPEESYFVITVRDDAGNPVLTDHMMTAETPLNLPEGHYTISDLAVVNEGEVLMAAPKRGSRLAQSVQDALGYEFDVKSGIAAALTIDVLEAASQNVADFGYTSLKPPFFAFTMRTRLVEFFDFSLVGTGLINVYWGDGTVEQHDLATTANFLTHNYAFPGVYIITVTGAVNQITDFYSFYGNGPISSINFSNTISLRDVRLGLTDGPARINLTKCPNLENVNIAGISQLATLLLPMSHHINFISISGPNALNTSDIGAITHNIYANAVANNITDGYFTYLNNWADLNSGPLGPPSAAATAKLTDLQDTYGWTLYPTP
ncbi:hypothetical protein [Dawidia soli]|uniref:PKD domain-containing protein n=1 Tax=Dawidia soli TaxID=2782352 RepID=A0AAP2DHT8_9BACT|nr:hypothetical protein [Dawidia soli]MBT1689637.1 hypothetical protein [Dawidia soli]